MKEIKVLNVYKHDFYQALTFIFKIKQDSAQAVFSNNFKKISHQYRTRFS